MFSTKSAQSLRNLFAGYHEPAGLSKQQSKKLLDGLKTSFRQQLDLEYGRGPERAAGPSAAATTAATDTDSSTRHSAATQHLKSILSNPLFSYSRQVGSAPASAPPSAKRDPMDVFDHAVAKGMMDLRAATGCLVAKRQMASRHDSPASSSSSSSSPSSSSCQTALRVLRWLRSTGAEADLGFLDDQAFLRALVPLLVAEDLEASAWEWMTRTVTDAGAPWDNGLRTRRAAFLLAQMVLARSQPQHGNLDAAIAAILRAEQLYHGHALLPGLLVLPWRSISWLATVGSYSRVPPSGDVFDAHMAVAHLLPRAVDVETAHLHLRHPTRPDHAPAVRFFGDRDRLRSLVRRLSPDGLGNLASGGGGNGGGGMRILSWIAFLGHDTVNHLSQLGWSHEAKSVTDLLRTELAAFSHEPPAFRTLTTS